MLLLRTAIDLSTLTGFSVRLMSLGTLRAEAIIYERSLIAGQVWGAISRFLNRKSKINISLSHGKSKLFKFLIKFNPKSNLYYFLHRLLRGCIGFEEVILFNMGLADAGRGEALNPLDSISERSKNTYKL